MLFLGKCGGLKKTKVGDFILPIAAIRGEGTSNDYMPPEIPALPSFRLQKAVSAMIVKHGLDYWTGTVYTTNRRVWEHDEKFKEYLKQIRASGIDMETATIFIVGFVNHIPKGALLLVSDSPMTPEGVKTSRSDKPVTGEVRARTPGDRHRLADRAPRLRRVGEAPAVRVTLLVRLAWRWSSVSVQPSGTVGSNTSVPRRPTYGSSDDVSKASRAWQAAATPSSRRTFSPMSAPAGRTPGLRAAGRAPLRHAPGYSDGGRWCERSPAG